MVNLALDRADVQMHLDYATGQLRALAEARERLTRPMATTMSPISEVPAKVRAVLDQIAMEKQLWDQHAQRLALVLSHLDEEMNQPAEQQP